MPTCNVMQGSFQIISVYRMKLGMFDPPSMQPFRSYSTSNVDTKEHQVRLV